MTSMEARWKSELADVRRWKAEMEKELSDVRRRKDAAVEREDFDLAAVLDAGSFVSEALGRRSSSRAASALAARAAA